MLSTYDRATRQKTAVLQNAMDTIETERLNNVSELTFTLPRNDTKNKHCGAFQLVRWEGGQLYRILDGTDNITVDGVDLASYSAEHVIATLIDDVLFETLQLDDLTTREVIEKILSAQTVKNWILGDCDFTRRFSYSWSNENLLTALFSIPNRFDQEYQWVFDTSVYPWRVHLKLLDQSINPQYYIRNGRNLLSASKTSNGRDICTRLYPLGYGEGINQLTIASVNGGKKYIDASPEAIAKYGIISRIWEDARFEDAQSLLDRARVLLNGYSNPYESYAVQAADLEKLTGQKYDTAQAGKIVWIDGYKTYVTQVERHLQEVGADTLELANAPEDIATSIADLADRQRINSVYAQGATNLYAQSFNDNADPTHPAVIQFYVPDEARLINKVALKFEFERFRAYSVGAESTETAVRSTSAGGKSTRSSSTTTSRDETSTSTTTHEETSTSTQTQEETSTSTDNQQRTSTSTDDQDETSAAGGGEYISTDSSPIFVEDVPTTTVNGHSHEYEKLASGYLSVSFTIDPHRHKFTVPGHYHSFEIPGHYHKVSIPGHYHKVNIPGHKHDVTIPGHNHTVDIPDHIHEVTIPGHTHKTIYGIYEGPRANTALLQVDGVNIPLAVGQTEIDVAAHLSTDSSGKIRRGTFHEIKIIPDALTRITATISVQLFIQSVGGGLY
jgi:phage minor structural protein